MAGLSAYRPTPTSEFRQGFAVDDEASMKMSPLFAQVPGY
jgi:hypothetical protein